MCLESHPCCLSSPAPFTEQCAFKVTAGLFVIPQLIYFYCRVISYCRGGTSSSSHLLRGVVVASSFRRLWIKLLYVVTCEFSCGHELSSQPSECAGARSPGHMARPCFAPPGAARPPPVAGPPRVFTSCAVFSPAFGAVSFWCSMSQEVCSDVAVFQCPCRVPDEKWCRASLHLLFVPSMYLLWLSVQSDLCPFFNWVVPFVIVAFQSSSHISNDSPFIRYVVCKYFLPVHGLSFDSSNCVFYKTKGFNFNKVICFLVMCCIIDVTSENSLLNPKSHIFCLCFLRKVL